MNVLRENMRLIAECSQKLVRLGENLWGKGSMEKETLIERVDNNGLPFNEWLSHKGAFHIPNGYEIKDENGNVINATKIVLEKKEKEYPKTYEECCKVLGGVTATWCSGYKSYMLGALNELLICRDAYWKIAGEEMGLGKPWEPDWDNLSINRAYIKINKGCFTYSSRVLVFPTEEMRDAFYENFKKLIESVKELL